MYDDTMLVDKSYYNELKDKAKSCEYWYQGYYKLLEELANYKWISVKDRLPDKDGKYFVCGDIHLWDIEKYKNNERIVIARFTKRKEWLTSLSVKYWMPLPNPPEKPYEAWDRIAKEREDALH